MRRACRRQPTIDESLRVPVSVTCCIYKFCPDASLHTLRPWLCSSSRPAHSCKHWLYKSLSPNAYDGCRYVLADATQHSLVLVDELGKGTEVNAGAALAGAILEALDEVGCKVGR